MDLFDEMSIANSAGVEITEISIEALLSTISADKSNFRFLARKHNINLAELTTSGLNSESRDALLGSSDERRKEIISKMLVLEAQPLRDEFEAAIAATASRRYGLNSNVPYSIQADLAINMMLDLNKSEDKGQFVGQVTADSYLDKKTFTLTNNNISWKVRPIIDDLVSVRVELMKRYPE